MSLNHQVPGAHSQIFSWTNMENLFSCVPVHCGSIKSYDAWARKEGYRSDYAVSLAKLIYFSSVT